jgi:hypothetical protein
MRPAFLAALLLVAASPAAALYSAGSPVLQLNPNNFKSKVSPARLTPTHSDRHRLLRFRNEGGVTRFASGAGAGSEWGGAGRVLRAVVRILQAADARVGEGRRRAQGRRQGRGARRGCAQGARAGEGMPPL